MLASQRKRATLEKKFERLGKELIEAQADAKDAADRVDDIQRQVAECQEGQRLSNAETREFVASTLPLEQHIELHPKLGIPREFFTRPEIAARGDQITAAFQIVDELQLLATAASAADEAHKKHREEDVKRQADAVLHEGPADITELVRMALGDDMVDTDGVVDAAERLRETERGTGFKERLALQLAKRRRQG